MQNSVILFLRNQIIISHSMANENIGIMEGAFFVSKSELLSWINNLLSLNISKVEQMASGAAYCQLIDIMYAGSMPKSKVSWTAKYDHEYVTNYKLLQQAFDKHGVHKHIEVEKLIKAKYQDNLEFFQWFKRFFDLNCRGGEGYNPVDRRKGAKTPWDITETGRGKTGDKMMEKQHKALSPKVLSPRVTSPRGPSPKFPAHLLGSEGNKVNSEQTERIEKLEKQVVELKASLEISEKEREFFFNKLRTVEMYCDHHESLENQAISDIQKILFATESEQVSLNEEGMVTFGKVKNEFNLEDF